MSKKAAKRYAQALFSYAKERDELDLIREEMSELNRIASSSEDLAAFFDHPLIPVDHRQKAIEALFKERVSDSTFRFLLLLEEKNRMGLFSGVCREYEVLYQQEKGILDILVCSAVPLEEAQAAKLKKQLKKKYNKSIQLRQAVDPGLVGGLRIQVGDMILDSSISHQLETFKMALIRA